jgi:tRNA(Ile2) C34 agmatinyltransferase TiaS
VDEERAPICPVCGVTMLPGALAGSSDGSDDWVCVECEEIDEPDE